MGSSASRFAGSRPSRQLHVVDHCASHAHPGGLWQVFVLLMPLLPQAFPVEHGILFEARSLKPLTSYAEPSGSESSCLAAGSNSSSHCSNVLSPLLV
jgi:hypothetical protein